VTISSHYNSFAVVYDTLFLQYHEVSVELLVNCSVLAICKELSIWVSMSELVVRLLLLMDGCLLQDVCHSSD